MWRGAAGGDAWSEKAAAKRLRRFTFEESLRFEKIHEDTCRRFGFTLSYVEPGHVSERVRSIRAAMELEKSNSVR